MLGIADLAEKAGLAPKTIRNLLCLGRLPAPDGRLGGSPWWHEKTVKEWLEGRMR